MGSMLEAVDDGGGGGGETGRGDHQADGIGQRHSFVGQGDSDCFSVLVGDASKGYAVDASDWVRAGVAAIVDEPRAEQERRINGETVDDDVGQAFALQFGTWGGDGVVQSCLD